MEKDIIIPYDDSIKIDTTKYPIILKDIIEELEKLYKENDWFNYDLKFTELEIMAKTYIGKVISEKEYDKLLLKYGGLYD